MWRSDGDTHILSAVGGRVTSATAGLDQSNETDYEKARDDRLQDS